MDQRHPLTESAIEADTTALTTNPDEYFRTTSEQATAMPRLRRRWWARLVASVRFR